MFKPFWRKQSSVNSGKQPRPEGVELYIDMMYDPLITQQHTEEIVPDITFEASIASYVPGSLFPEAVPEIEEKLVHDFSEACPAAGSPQREDDFIYAAQADIKEDAEISHKLCKDAEISHKCCVEAPAFDLDESFSDRLQRLLYEKDITAPQCYKRACLDRKLFSKICSNKNYRPSKNTVLSLAIALELDMTETRDFLEAAGYALSHSILSDVIIEFYISKGFYDIFGINEVLCQYDQALLGS